MDNKDLLNKDFKESKTEILKNEWCNFFWKRFFISLVIGLISGLLFRENSSNYQFISNVISYLLSSYLIMNMINSAKSRLVLKRNDNSIKANYTEVLKMYWSFFWREFMYGLLLGFVVVVFVLIFIVTSLNQGFAYLLAFLLGISVMIASYYIGRHVFIEVVKEVSWNNKKLDVEK